MLVIEKIDSLLELYNSDCSYEKEVLLLLKKDFLDLNLNTEKYKMSFVEQRIFKLSNKLFSNKEILINDSIDKLKIKLNIYAKIFFEMKELSSEDKFAFINSVSYELVKNNLNNLAKEDFNYLITEFIKIHFQEYLLDSISLVPYVVGVTIKSEFVNEDFKQLNIEK